MDLKNFFGTLNFGRVRGFFIKDDHFKLSDSVATIIAQIACYNNSLPQGSPCSPVITNFILHVLDLRLVKIAQNNSCYYTRYADDLTFSTNENSFPKEIFFLNSTNGEWLPSKNLKREIKRAGFEINNEKNRLQFKNSRQDVTGLIVNKLINVPVEFRKSARVMTFNLFQTNSYYYMEKKEQGDGYEKKEGTISKLTGVLSYIYSIRQRTIHKVDEHDKEKNKEFDSNEKLYSNFLFYKYFSNNIKPILICEGKTDVVYFKYAIKSLSKKYPTLIEKVDKKNKFKLHILNDSKTVKHLLRLLKGTDEIKKFIETYEERLKVYNAPSLSQPVIIVLDNDEGCIKIKKIVESKFKKEINPAGFTHVTKNLYLILTQLKDDAKESKIEDCFDNKTLSIKLNGKTFNSKNKFDTTAHFGKDIFSKDIVMKNHKKIDFTGFTYLLDEIERVIAHHK